MEKQARIGFLASLVVAASTQISAHSSGGHMHSAGHMTGYNMWGMGHSGMIIGIVIWALVALGIFYLYQKITEEE